jgi:Fe-S-cluster-containing hydrogenase component 2
MLKNDGIITYEELKACLPPENRYEKGPVAIIECLQDIPCDPCVLACPVKAIEMKEGITTRPNLNFDKCTGCGVCVPKCPGLAIFIVNKKAENEKANLTMSYELLPLPEKNQEVIALDRSGKDVCKAKVVKVLNPVAFDKTATVTIEIPSNKIHDIRGLKVMQGGVI